MEPYSYMKINNVKYIDLLNFFPLPLYAVPKTFGLTELKKGSYDHFWTCMPANRKWDRSLTWSITIEMVWVLLPTKNSKWCTKNRWGCRYQRSSPVRSCIGCILAKFWWYLEISQYQSLLLEPSTVYSLSLSGFHFIDSRTSCSQWVTSQSSRRCFIVFQLLSS